jgi:hypothetical protein
MADNEYDDDEPGSLPEFASTNVLPRTSSPHNLSAASSPGLPGSAAKRPEKGGAGVDAKKGKKRKNETAAEKILKPGEDGESPAKKKKKPTQPKKPTTGDKKSEADGAKSPAKVSADPSADRDRATGHEAGADGEGKERLGEETAEDEDEEVDEEDYDLAMDEKYKRDQEARNRLFHDQLKTKADWNRYTDMRRATLNEKSVKTIIAATADIPESQVYHDAGSP